MRNYLWSNDFLFTTKKQNDDSVRLLSHEMEGLNYSLLYQAYFAKDRNPAVAPRLCIWKKSVGKWEAKMYGRIQEAVCILNQEYLCRFRVGEENEKAEIKDI